VPDEPDYELLKPPHETHSRALPKRPIGLWIVVTVFIAATAIAVYIMFGRQRSAPATAVAPEHVDAPQRAVEPLGGDAAPIVLPPLDESDALVREMVKKISSHPRVAAWLATDGLIRNFTLVVANVAEGKTPAGQLRVLRPSSNFRVVERSGDLNIDPRTYERYDALAAAAASLDPKGSARLYATLKPRVEEAYRELGFPNTPFDRTLERAIVQLLGTPLLDGPVRIEPRGIGYRFAAPGLEALSPAQKQLLRTGSRNVRVVQASFREIAHALGIPPERLPSPPR